jgi:uncharacterized protein (DUF58 family)
MTELLSASFLRRLEGLAIAVRRQVSAGPAGERPGRRHGQSLEFADHRPYTPGDDLRHLDWTLLGRLDRPFVRLFEERSELGVQILLDATGSMAHGKWLAARQLAAALAYVALAGGDRVSLAGLGGGTSAPPPPVRGRERVAVLLSYLQALGCSGHADLLAQLRRQLAARPRGAVLLVSDLLLPDAELDALLALLASAPRQASVVLVVGPEELGQWDQAGLWDSGGDGEVRLHDSETGETLDVTLDEAMRQRYADAFERHARRLEGRARQLGLTSARAPVHLPLEQVVLSSLRAQGVLR